MPLVNKNRKPVKLPKSIRVDLTGKTFGQITVLGYSRRTNDVSHWLCECSCGNKVEAIHGNLNGGRTTRCSDCQGKIIGDAHRTHGASGSKGYSFWRRRWSKLCKSWQKDFHKFKAECIDKQTAAYLLAVDETKPVGPKNYRWSNIRGGTLGLMIDGKHVDSHEAMQMLGISRQRVAQLRNRQNGLCACGRELEKKYTRCERCRTNDIESKRRNHKAKK